MATYLPNGWVLTDDGYYVGGDGTNIKHTAGQYQQIEKMRSDAASMIPIQYDEAGTRITPDNVNAGTPQQLGAMQWAQQQQQPANLGGLLTGPNVQQWGIDQLGAVTPAQVYSAPSSVDYANYTSQDAQDYFSRYPDLMPAYLANNYGMNPTQWAQQHFNTYGKNEQRTWGATEPTPLANPVLGGPTQQTTQGTYTGTPKVDLSPIRKQMGGAVPFPTASPISGGTTMLGTTPNYGTSETNFPQQTPWAPAPSPAPQYSTVQDTSAWRANPTALTPMQQAGRGMLYS